jgi:hypothetical protein
MNIDNINNNYLKPVPAYKLNESYKNSFKKLDFDEFIKKIKDRESLIMRFVYPFKDKDESPQSFGIKYHQLQINKNGKTYYPRKICNKFIDYKNECVDCNNEKENLISSFNDNMTEIGTITDINESKKRSEYINIGIVLEKVIIENDNQKTIKTDINQLKPQIYQMGKMIFEDILKYTNPITTSRRVKKHDIHKYDFLIERCGKGLDTKYNITVIDPKEDEEYYDEEYEKKLENIIKDENNDDKFNYWYNTYMKTYSYD